MQSALNIANGPIAPGGDGLAGGGGRSEAPTPGGAEALGMTPVPGAVVAGRRRMTLGGKKCKCCRRGVLYKDPRTGLALQFVDGVCTVCVEVAGTFCVTVAELVARAAASEDFRQRCMTTGNIIMRVAVKTFVPQAVSSQQEFGAREFRCYIQLTADDIRAKYGRKSLPRKVQQRLRLNEEGTHRVLAIINPERPYRELHVYRTVKCNMLKAL